MMSGAVLVSTTVTVIAALETETVPKESVTLTCSISVPTAGSAVANVRWPIIGLMGSAVIDQ